MKDVKKQFSEQRESVSPSSEFEQRLWQRLDAEFVSAIPTRKSRRSLRYAVSIVAVVVIFFGGTGAYAYASPSVAPDSTLYPVRKGIESVEAVLHRSPEGKAAFHARMAERRAAELERFPDFETQLRENIQDRVERGDIELDRLHHKPEVRERYHKRFETLREAHLLERIDEAVENGDIDEVAAEQIKERIQEGALDVPPRTDRLPGDTIQDRLHPEPDDTRSEVSDVQDDRPAPPPVRRGR